MEGYDALIDAVVVDLFAGSGALGLEALSRGAASAELVDKAEAAHRTLSRNAAHFGSAAGAHKADALRYLSARQGPPVELLFLDPPYQLREQALADILAAALPQLHEAATVVVERDEHSPEPSWPEGMVRFQDKKYGSTHIWLAEPD